MCARACSQIFPAGAATRRRRAAVALPEACYLGSYPGSYLGGYLGGYLCARVSLCAVPL